MTIMKTCVITAEYNPFHNGHAWQIKQARELGAENVVVVMSGNYVQRGTPALFPKEVRVSAALCCGADLVLELPVPYAVSGAEQFASSAVHIANALGVADSLVFGTETDDIGEILEISNMLLSEECDALIKEKLKTGESYAVARALAAEELRRGSAEILTMPNNILAVEYCKAIIKSKSSLIPVCIKRKGVQHNSDKAEKGFASASFLRESPLEGWHGLVPAKANIMYSAENIRGNIVDYSRFETAVLSRLRACTPQGLARLREASEGLEYALYNAVQQAVSLEQVYAKTKSKRYAHSRIRRMVLCAVLGITTVLPELPPYIRVLGANNRGFALLGQTKGKLKLPVSHSLANLEKLSLETAAVASAEVRGGNLYSLCLKTPQPAGGEYRYSIVKV